MHKGQMCVYAGPLKDEDRPSDLVVCSDMKQIDQVEKAIPTPRKVF